MKRALRTILFGLIFTSSSIALAQDPELTQFYAAPVYTNPALAGSAVCQTGAAGRFATNYRNQWPNLPGTFRSYCASWDQHMPAVGGGVGAMVFHDVAGSGLLTVAVSCGLPASFFSFSG